MSSKQTQWLDYPPSPVVGSTASSSFCAVSVYSRIGDGWPCVRRAGYQTRPWWGCSNVTCCSPCLVGFILFYFVNSVVLIACEYSEKQDTDGTSVGLAGDVGGGGQ